MEPIVHLVIPVLILLAFTRKPEYLYLAPFALLPDLDALWHHRGFHSLLLVPLVFSVFYLLEKKNKKYRNYGLVASFLVLSHLILDIGYPGVALLAPFSSLLYYVDLSIIYAFPPIVKLEYGANNLILYSDGCSHILTTLGIEIILVLLLFFLIRKKIE